jgi:hypothetical protein
VETSTILEQLVMAQQRQAESHARLAAASEKIAEALSQIALQIKIMLAARTG